jgi:hypothetical protein
MTSSRQTLICVATLALTCAALATPARAVPINFTGTQQDFNLTLDATGNGTFTGALPRSLMLIGLDYALGTVTLQPDGFNLKVVDNPYSTSISLKDNAPVKLTSDPRSIGLPKDAKGNFQIPGIADIGIQRIFENGAPTGTYKMVSATNLDLDMLNTKTVNFALAEIQLPRTQLFVNDFYDGTPENGPEYYPGSPSALKLNVSGTVKEMYLEQDDAGTPTFTPDGPAGDDGISHGTFSIPATLNATLDALIKVGGFDVEELKDETVDSKLNITGRYTMEGPANAVTLKLFGSSVLPFPLGLNSGLVLDGGNLYGITATVDLAASINFAYNFALTTVVAIPEPGSIVLLVIGLMAVSPLMVGRLKRMVRRDRAA